MARNFDYSTFGQVKSPDRVTRPALGEAKGREKFLLTPLMDESLWQIHQPLATNEQGQKILVDLVLPDFQLRQVFWCHSSSHTVLQGLT